jgi:hypothetical protein
MTKQLTTLAAPRQGPTLSHAEIVALFDRALSLNDSGDYQEAVPVYEQLRRAGVRVSIHRRPRGEVTP